MIDQTHIDLLALVGGELKKSGRQWVGACPFCGGHDRFYVDAKGWGCRHCSQGYNDALAFVAKRDGLNLRSREGMAAALEVLQIAQDAPPARTRKEPRPESHTGDMSEYPCFEPEYQRACNLFVSAANEALQHNDGVLEYLLDERRLETAALMAASVGLNTQPHRDCWGSTEVFLPTGIVLPWEQGNTFYRVRFRTNNPNQRYRQAAGAANALYHIRPILRGSIVVLAEGEFDALALTSELIRWSRRTGYSSSAVVGVATGGVTNARILRHAALLSVAKRVCLAYDSDTAGEQASKWWAKALPNAVRLRPNKHDINDMVVAGDDVARWIQRVL